MRKANIFDVEREAPLFDRLKPILKEDTDVDVSSKCGVLVIESLRLEHSELSNVLIDTKTPNSPGNSLNYDNIKNYIYKQDEVSSDINRILYNETIELEDAMALSAIAVLHSLEILDTTSFSLINLLRDSLVFNNKITFSYSDEEDMVKAKAVPVILLDLVNQIKGHYGCHKILVIHHKIEKPGLEYLINELVNAGFKVKDNSEDNTVNTIIVRREIAVLNKTREETRDEK